MKERIYRELRGKPVLIKYFLFQSAGILLIKTVNAPNFTWNEVKDNFLIVDQEGANRL